MDTKQHYHTRQSRQIADYLQTMPGQHVTAAEVCDHFARQGVRIGKVTVYRHLERLVEEGLVAKYTVDGSNAACYAYLGAAEAAAPQPCYHCKCEVCGALLHLHCAEVEQLNEHLRTHHGFALDARRTVFYGICPACRAAAGQ